MWTWIVVPILSSIITLDSALVRWSYLGKDSASYDSKIVVMSVEIVKLIVSAGLVIRNTRSIEQTWSKAWLLFPCRKTMQYAIPAFLYAVTDNLKFFFLELEAPAEYVLLWNFKIVATTFLLSCWLKRRYARQQWLGVGLLILGVMLAEFSHISSGISPNEVVPNNATSNNDSVPSSSQVPSKSSSWTALFFGPFLTLVGATVAAFANVYCESLYKQDLTEEDMWVKNIRLYSFGILTNIIGLVVQSTNKTMTTSTKQVDLFFGFNIFVVLIIVNSSFGGLLIGYILKAIDNIAVIHADAIATVLSTILSFLLFGQEISGWFIIGASFVIFSIYLYKIPISKLQTCLADDMFDMLEQESYRSQPMQTEEASNTSKSSKRVEAKIGYEMINMDMMIDEEEEHNQNLEAFVAAYED
eukprot:g3968.t1